MVLAIAILALITVTVPIFTLIMAQRSATAALKDALKAQAVIIKNALDAKAELTRAALAAKAEVVAAALKEIEDRGRTL